MKFNKIALLITLCFSIFYASSQDKSQTPNNKISKVVEDEEVEALVEEETDENAAKTIKFFDQDLAYYSYVLVNYNSNHKAITYHDKMSQTMSR